MSALHVGYAGSLDEAVAEALDRIDQAAGAARARYITDVPGQAETYLDKYDDALRYLDDTSPALSSYPWVRAEATATGTTAQQAAMTIVGTRDAWRQIGVTIEEARMSGKTRVRSEVTTTGVFLAMRDALSVLEAL